MSATSIPMEWGGKRSKRRKVIKAKLSRPQSGPTIGPGVGEPTNDNETALERVWGSQTDLVLIPIELLNIIFEYLVATPRALIALSRSNKYLRSILLDPASDRFWKRAAKDCIPQPLPTLPDGTDFGFTARAYIEFVFDTGSCEVCGRPTNEMFASFSLKLRLCIDTDCWMEIKQPGILLTIARPNKPEPLMNSIMLLEDNNRLESACRLELPVDIPVCRSAEWSRRMRKYNLQKNQYRPWSQRDAFHKLCHELVDWKRIYKKHADAADSNNRVFTEELAQQEGFQYWDFMSCPTYSSLSRRYTNSELTTIPRTDYDALSTRIKTEITNIQQRRKRRDYEKNYMAARTQYKLLYDQFYLTREIDQHLPFPSWATFLKLPAVRDFLLSLDTDTDLTPEKITGQLKANWHARFILRELKQFASAGRNKMIAMVEAAQGGESQPQEGEVPILERITTRFICKNCANTPPPDSDGSFTFTGACAHNCRTGDKRWEWEPGRFIVDMKASAAMRQLLAGVNVDARDQKAWEHVQNIGHRVVCHSCKPPVLMGTSMVPGHSHRHEDMVLKVVSPAEAATIREEPILAGLVKHLLSLPRAKENDTRDKKAYSCVHCKTKTNFNGLKSHLLGKHKIKHIRDEDFYVNPSFDKSQFGDYSP